MNALNLVEGLVQCGFSTAKPKTVNANHNDKHSKRGK